ncbi:hypothetical protein EVJ50_09890 [Synechococcus sp. RSCCF101]|uniref:hercynine metabolism protein n=1 Tax=Synechococcus sp. RSCCF101 TaxID=2511069 RepID=UPI001243EACE|nr:hercynine metabolism protein [Synechococcus sp. RSCCF101]QEY32481.1 hypothetical protein EVJ50_09890 [Synechococcus sp. RSCCF101]
MAGSWFQDLEQKLDEQLEAFLRSNPDQRQRLEQQERQERSQWLHRRQKQLTASAGQQRQELMELAEEISRWRERVERARAAGAEDLAERAADHLMRLMAQGREHWQALASLGEEITRLGTELSELEAETRDHPPGQTVGSRSGSTGSSEAGTDRADSLKDAWERFESEQELERLRRRAR